MGDVTSNSINLLVHLEKNKLELIVINNNSEAFYDVIWVYRSVSTACMLSVNDKTTANRDNGVYYKPLRSTVSTVLTICNFWLTQLGRLRIGLTFERNINFYQNSRK